MRTKQLFVSVHQQTLANGGARLAHYQITHSGRVQAQPPGTQPNRPRGDQYDLTTGSFQRGDGAHKRLNALGANLAAWPSDKARAELDNHAPRGAQTSLPLDIQCLFISAHCDIFECHSLLRSANFSRPACVNVALALASCCRASV